LTEPVCFLGGADLRRKPYVGKSEEVEVEVVVVVE
jgi:hypothetical protein